MLEVRTIGLVAGRELGEARRNRWFLLFAATFAVLALSVAGLSVSGLVGPGIAAFGRTAASLVGLVALVVPLLGLTLGAGAVAGERERGSLAYLLAQPLRPAEVVVGKFLGLAAALTAALAVGFGAAAALLARRGAGGELGDFLAFVALSVLVGWASLAIGLALSCFARRAAVAAGAALFAWLALVLLADLGVMGAATAMRLAGRELLLATLVNPLQAFKVASLARLHGGLEMLGPAGVAAAQIPVEVLVPALVGILAAWTVTPVLLAAWRLERRGAVA
jgi:Cu-processing system permease protein